MASSILDLHDDILREICNYLNACELIAFSSVNKRLNTLIISENTHPWKRLCELDWLKYEKRSSELSWLKCYKEMYEELGEHVTTYKKIMPVWTAFKDLVEKKCPNLTRSLKPGLCKKEILKLESKYEIEFPNPLKLLYTLFNGQKILSNGEGIALGLFGSTNHFLHNQLFAELNAICLMLQYTSDDGNGLVLNDHDEIVHIFPFSWMNGPHNPRHLIGLCMVCYKHENGTVIEYVTLAPMHEVKNLNCHLVIGRSLVDWFIMQMKDTLAENYEINSSGITNCKNDPKSIAKTGSITVTVGWTVSLDHNYHPFFPYRITMEMDQTASTSESCQLETRHWVINDFKLNKISKVNGYGVVGEFPIMTPGSKFSWISCTYFSRNGSMEGHFVMKKLNSDEKFNLVCPKFTMTVPNTLSDHIGQDSLAT